MRCGDADTCRNKLFPRCHRPDTRHRQSTHRASAIGANAGTDANIARDRRNDRHECAGHVVRYRRRRARCLGASRAGGQRLRRRRRAVHPHVKENFHACHAIHAAASCRIGALRQVHRGVQAHPLGHRPRRHPPARIRLHEEVPARRPVARRAPVVPRRRRAPPAVADPGAVVREHLRPGRALHRRQDARAEPRPLAGRSGRARGAGALHRRGAEAPGAVPPDRDDDRRGNACRLHIPAAAQRRRVGGARRSRPGRCSR